MTEFARPREGARFSFAGLKTNVLPDALPAGKFALAQNVRATQDDSLVTRPGQTLRFLTPTAAPITDLRTYSSIEDNLSTDNLPRILARDTSDAIWLDDPSTTPMQVGTLTAGGLGATMLPFRPNASPTPWMYIANGSDYQKLSAPDAADTVVQANVGIAEPQDAPVAYISAMQSIFVDSDDDTPPFTPTGTMGTITDGARVTDTVVAVFPDPAAATGPCTTSIQVAGSVQYQRFMKLLFGDSLLELMVQDVFPAIPTSLISSIYYFNGTTGRCVVVPGGPAGFAQGPGATIDSLYGSLLLSSLRRGSLVQIGSEVCFVLSVTTGPQGTVCFETITTSAHAASETLTGVPAIQVFGGQTVVATDTVISPDYEAAVTTGIGIATATLGADTSERLRPTTYTNPSPLHPPIIPPNLPWANPASAFDALPDTYASAALGSNLHATCQWQTWAAPGFPYDSIILYVESEVPPPVGGGSWGAALEYSVDAGATWNSIFATGGFGGAGSRLRQINAILLPPDVNIATDLIVRAALDTLNDVDASMRVYDINTLGISAGPFTSPFILQPEDYVHFSINVDDLTKLTEMKIKFAIDTDNYYYYTVRPSDLAAAVAGTETQIAATQTVIQRAIIDQLTASAANNQGTTASSAQTPPGTSQWAEILFPISSLTRVGNDQTKSLADAASVILEFTASGTINVAWNSIFVFGGFQADVGDIGAPYLYRARPRSKLTGVVGNPSPATRAGTSPRRQQVTVNLPDATYDPQIDTWDIFRYGGSVTSWRYIGSTPSTNTTFPDNYSDEAADVGNALDFDNFEPWPSVDIPLSGTASLVNGTTAIISTTRTKLLRYLPGTLVQLGGLNVYTLWKRPISLGGDSYLLEFVENAGASMTVPFSIQEPALARQPLPYLWGPDADGTVFACGDPLRPGTLYFSKPNAPDSAPDAFNTEITPPTEPLLGGEILDGLSLVGSSERWWALYPQPSSPARYNVVQQPILRGIAAPFGHCTDSVSIYFWAKDGIWSSTKGSLTDGDLYNLFPHEGVPGKSIVYAGHTVQPPDYSRTGTFRLTCSNGYLYAVYQDSSGIYRTLVLDLKRMAWSVDVYSPTTTAFCHPEQQAGTVLSTTALYPELLMATVDGRVAQQTVNVNDLDAGIACLVAVPEFDGGDVRAPKQWGDGFLDLVPAAAASVSATPMALGAAAAPATSLAVAGTRQRLPISVGGVVVSDFLGLLLAWTDDFNSQTVPTQLYIWQPSFVVQPARTIAWYTFGTAFGQDGYMHIREIAVAYVAAADVTLTIVSFDGQSPAPITLPATSGQYRKVMIPLTANKGQLYRFAATSSADFQFFFDEWETHVGQWRRSGPYASVRGFGGRELDASPI